MRERHDDDGRESAHEEYRRSIGAAERETVRETVRQALESDPVRTLLDAADAAGAAVQDTAPAVLVVGPPRSGKTTFAIDAAK